MWSVRPIPCSCSAASTPSATDTDQHDFTLLQCDVLPDVTGTNAFIDLGGVVRGRRRWLQSQPGRQIFQRDADPVAGG
jgi:hypothetical protein